MGRYRSRKYLVSKKKSRYRSRKYLVSKKSLGVGLENILSRKKVSVSVSKIFGLEKKSRYRSQKLWSQKSLGIGLENFGLKKSLSNNPKIFVLENFGPGNG